LRLRRIWGRLEWKRVERSRTAVNSAMKGKPLDVLLHGKDTKRGFHTEPITSLLQCIVGMSQVPGIGGEDDQLDSHVSRLMAKQNGGT